MEKNIIKPFGLKRNLEYFKIMLKHITEYPINFWSSLMTESIFQLTFILGFLGIIATNFSSIINWELVDFFIFGVLVGFVSDVSGIFGWKLYLADIIKSGQLNQYLVRPINPFLGRFFHDLSLGAIVAIVIDFIIFSIILLYYNIEIYNIGLFISILLLLIIFKISSLVFIQSFAFISLGLSDFLIKIRNTLENDLLFSYPAQFFKTFNLKFIFYLISFYFIGLLLVPLLRGYEIWRIDIQLSILISLIIIFSLGTIINWHYGLKKYEAFG